MQFKDIAGQQDVINRLTEAADSGRVSHAQMFVGRAADGTLQLAWAYLQYLCCKHHVKGEGELRSDSCGECPECKKIASLQHPDLHLIFPNAATKSVSKDYWSGSFMPEFHSFLKENRALGTIDDWYNHLGIENKQGIIRELDAANIISALQLKSYEGGWKMILIWLPEKMNAPAANELLKTLEEPTPQTILLLASESDERLLPTIRSRVQTVRLRSADTMGRLAATEQFAPLMVEWLRMLFKLKMIDLAAEVEKLAAMGREQQKQFLGYTMEVMRRCFLHNAAGTSVDIASGDAKFDTMFPTMVTVNNIEAIESAIDEALFAIERNANSKIALMQLSFNISKALKKR